MGAPPLTDLESGRCPACQRVRDRRPAGTIRLPSELFGRRTEILGLIHNVERKEKAEHPLERLMDVEESEGHLVVTTTGIHFRSPDRPQARVPAAPQAAPQYAEGESLLRVDWE